MSEYSFLSVQFPLQPHCIMNESLSLGFWSASEMTIPQLSPGLDEAVGGLLIFAFHGQAVWRDYLLSVSETWLFVEWNLCFISSLLMAFSINSVYFPGGIVHIWKFLWLPEKEVLFFFYRNVWDCLFGIVCLEQSFGKENFWVNDAPRMKHFWEFSLCA